MLFWGLVERDAELFNKGLTYILNHHVSEVEDLEKYFSYDGVALAMLAMDRGIEITVEHELLPMEFLESTQIDYAGIENVFEVYRYDSRGRLTKSPLQKRIGAICAKRLALE